MTPTPKIEDAFVRDVYAGLLDVATEDRPSYLASVAVGCLRFGTTGGVGYVLITCGLTAHLREWAVLGYRADLYLAETPVESGSSLDFVEMIWDNTTEPTLRTDEIEGVYLGGDGASILKREWMPGQPLLNQWGGLVTAGPERRDGNKAAT